MKDFQGPKTKFKYFQGLEIGLLKFKGFQGLSRRVRTLTNVNTPFFQVPTLGFGHSAGVNFLHTNVISGAVHCIVLTARLVFQNGI